MLRLLEEVGVEVAATLVKPPFGLDLESLDDGVRDLEGDRGAASTVEHLPLAPTGIGVPSLARSTWAAFEKKGLAASFLLRSVRVWFSNS